VAVVDNTAGGEDHRPLDAVLRFPDIPRPVIGGHQVDSPRGDVLLDGEFRGLFDDHHVDFQGL
jgi:hypothetical protein